VDGETDSRMGARRTRTRTSSPGWLNPIFARGIHLGRPLDGEAWLIFPPNSSSRLLFPSRHRPRLQTPSALLPKSRESDDGLVVQGQSTAFASGGRGLSGEEI